MTGTGRFSVKDILSRGTQLDFYFLISRAPMIYAMYTVSSPVAVEVGVRALTTSRIDKDLEIAQEDPREFKSVSRVKMIEEPLRVFRESSLPRSDSEVN